MNRISAAMRISIALACLLTSILFVAQSLGLFPDTERPVLEGRKALCEAIAVQSCLAAQRNDQEALRTIIEALVARNHDVLSAAVRRASGKLVVEAGEHGRLWTNDDGILDMRHAQVKVPIMDRKKVWGVVEICFRPAQAASLAEWFASPAMRLVLFVGAISCVVFTLYLKRTLQHLDPSSVIPDRVRATLDTLAEGVLVLDKNQRIVLANKAFAKNTGQSPDQLQGSKAPRLEFFHPHSDKPTEQLPWENAVREGVSQTGVMVGLQSKKGRRTFVVNSMPILGADGRHRGALATFDDVTSVEQKNLQLKEMLETLKSSRDEISRQNQELTLLATRDPLTGCLNRRAFYSQFETVWQSAKKNHAQLCCLMIDIDHFKSVNDTHGHATGDLVLQHVAALLKAAVRADDLVCRYGGEEFCVLLPHTDIAQAAIVAEKLRSEIERRECPPVKATVSLGMSGIEFGAGNPPEMLEQADKALYFSKRAGRNRVTCWQDLPADFEMRRDSSRDKAVPEIENDVPIPFHAVSALMSALAYRDALTAEHSRRVADLCVATARGLVPERLCYVFEVAALLHDIGKLGVPDAILLKPGSLTPEEWKIMSTHDRIGVEIISAAFSSPELTEIVRTHHACYGGSGRDPGLPKGTDIPLGARILTIADAYDAMVSDRVYRKGRSRDEAFVELRKFAGIQFDPELVERFVTAVMSQDQSRTHAPLTVSKQTALRIGIQIERLAGALDSQDFPKLSAMAERLSATARNDGVSEIADRAGELAKAASEDNDLLTIVALTTDLLQLCRSTRHSFVTAASAEDEETMAAEEVGSRKSEVGS